MSVSCTGSEALTYVDVQPVDQGGVHNRAGRALNGSWSNRQSVGAGGQLRVQQERGRHPVLLVHTKTLHTRLRRRNKDERRGEEVRNCDRAYARDTRKRRSRSTGREVHDVQTAENAGIVRVQRAVAVRARNCEIDRDAALEDPRSVNQQRERGSTPRHRRRCRQDLRKRRQPRWLCRSP